MRFLARGWASGELSDEESERALSAYRERLEAIMPRLPPALRALASDVDLHDAIIERVRWAPHQRHLRLSLVRSDRTRKEFELVVLTYDGATLGEERLEPLRRAALSRQTELLHDEVDVDDDGVLCHRLLFRPNEELTLECAGFAMSRALRPDRRVRLEGALLVESVDRDCAARAMRFASRTLGRSPRRGAPARRPS